MKNFLLTKGSMYAHVARMGARINFAYRSNVIFQLANVLFQVYLLKVVWTAVYLQSGNINHVQLQSIISYLTLANLQTWVLTPTITDVLQDRIRTGDIALDITKPISLPGLLIAQQFGASLSLLPFAIITLPLAWLVGGMQAPASFTSLIFYIISFLLAYGIVALMGLLMGLISLWTFEVTGIQLIYRFINQLFAGVLIPLWLFPSALRTIANFLPFQAVAFLPVSIYLGQLQGRDILRVFIIQIFWLTLLFFLAQWTWTRAQRYMIIQGG